MDEQNTRLRGWGYCDQEKHKFSQKKKRKNKISFKIYILQTKHLYFNKRGFRVRGNLWCCTKKRNARSLCTASEYKELTILLNEMVTAVWIGPSGQPKRPWPEPSRLSILSQEHGPKHLKNKQPIIVGETDHLAYGAPRRKLNRYVRFETVRGKGWEN